MLTYIDAKIENDPHTGGIRISGTGIVDDLNLAKAIVISRKEVTQASADWNDVCTIHLESIDDLNFSVLDITALSGSTYEYTIEIMPEDMSSPIEFEVSDAIKCEFDGLFIGDAETQFVAHANFKTETKQNTAVAYVTTILGRYPYRVSNADTNYTTGTSSGLFLKVSEDKKSLIPDDNHKYSDAVIAFLTNGKNKVLKTHDGQAWYVSIDANPNKVYSDFIGMNAVQFNWTQIGDIPSDWSKC